MRRTGLLIVILWVTACSSLASRIVRDDFGRSVTLPDHPRRVICLTPAVADTVYAVGGGNEVVAVSDFTNYPAEARRKPSVGQPLNPSLEVIVSLHPDLVIGSSDFSGAWVVGQLQELGIPIFLVNPHGLEGILDAVVTVGKALNREAEANVVAARLRTRVRAVQTRIKGKPVVRVLMLIWPDPIETIGKRSYITDVIAAAGGRSITDDLEQEWPHIGFEALMARSPQAILLVRDSKMSFDDLAKRKEWSGLGAIREHRVFYADERLYCPSPVVVEALEGLARQFHPGGKAVSASKP